MSKDNNWNYFPRDPQYFEVLKTRLENQVQMISALGLCDVMNLYPTKKLSILDFGSGPGHYYPVIRKKYHGEISSYHGVDFIATNVRNGNLFFEEIPVVYFSLGDLMEPESIYRQENCILSANTLPHIPTIEPLLSFIRKTESIQFLFFRMLIGSECVEIKKHLDGDDFDQLFSNNYQHNNIYSLKYIKSILGARWSLTSHPDRIDKRMLESHSIPEEENNPFYSNRVSRYESGKIFKGEIYMPWKYVVGIRN